MKSFLLHRAVTATVCAFETKKISPPFFSRPETPQMLTEEAARWFDMLDTPQKLTENDVLAVDLDGTLTPVDTFRQAAMSLLRTNPMAFIKSLLHGKKASIKHAVAQQCPVDPKGLPVNADVVDAMVDWKKRGGHVVLATGAPFATASAVAERFPCIDAVLASDIETNLVAANKANALRANFPNARITYIGNSSQDLAVWAMCDVGFNVGPRRFDGAPTSGPRPVMRL